MQIRYKVTQMFWIAQYAHKDRLSEFPSEIVVESPVVVVAEAEAGHIVRLGAAVCGVACEEHLETDIPAHLEAFGYLHLTTCDDFAPRVPTVLVEIGDGRGLPVVHVPDDIGELVVLTGGTYAEADQ